MAGASPLSPLLSSVKSMPVCSCPIPVWFAHAENKPGEPLKRRGRVLFSPRGADLSQPIQEIPCGKCRNCLRGKAEQWGVRVAAEAAMHEQSWFITGTYSDENLPLHGSLRRDHFTNFIRAIRRNLGPVRYLGCGEYSPAPLLRPHIHAALFGINLPPMRQVATSKRGHPLYGCPELDAVWPHGQITAGVLNAASGSYVASYTIKGTRKATAADYWRDNHYVPGWGEFYTGPVEPEFIRMSLRPGIGSRFVGEFADELLTHDNMIVDGQPRALPRYFDKLLTRDHCERFEDLKAARLDKAADRLAKRRGDRFAGSAERDHMHNQAFSDAMSKQVALRDMERGA